MTIFPERPEISMSFPVRSTILSVLPTEHIVATMHLMHSAVPGSGAYMHREQFIIRAPPERAAGGGSGFLSELLLALLPGVLPGRIFVRSIKGVFD